MTAITTSQRNSNNPGVLEQTHLQGSSSKVCLFKKRKNRVLRDRRCKDQPHWAGTAKKTMPPAPEKLNSRIKKEESKESSWANMAGTEPGTGAQQSALCLIENWSLPSEPLSSSCV
jgi:hypothetical protein